MNNEVLQLKKIINEKKKKIDELEKDNNLKSKYQCKVCLKGFVKESFLERHIVKVHNVSIAQVDGFDPEYSSEIGNAEDCENMSEERGNPKPNKPGHIQCPELCDKTFISFIDLNYHLKQEHIEEN